jgi:transcription initiation factor IIE alpha subunit
MLQQPQVQQMLIAMLGSIVSSFSAPKVQHVSGTQDIEQIVQTLFSKGVTADDLAKLAAMPQAQISMLLSMLRK